MEILDTVYVSIIYIFVYITITENLTIHHTQLGGKGKMKLIPFISEKEGGYTVYFRNWVEFRDR